MRLSRKLGRRPGIIVPIWKRPRLSSGHKIAWPNSGLEYPVYPENLQSLVDLWDLVILLQVLVDYLVEYLVTVVSHLVMLEEVLVLEVDLVLDLSLEAELELEVELGAELVYLYLRRHLPLLVSSILDLDLVVDLDLGSIQYHPTLISSLSDTS